MKMLKAFSSIYAAVLEYKKHAWYLECSRGTFHGIVSIIIEVEDLDSERIVPEERFVNEFWNTGKFHKVARRELHVIK